MIESMVNPEELAEWAARQKPGAVVALVGRWREIKTAAGLARMPYQTPISKGLPQGGRCVLAEVSELEPQLAGLELDGAALYRPHTWSRSEQEVRDYLAMIVDRPRMVAGPSLNRRRS